MLDRAKGIYDSLVCADAAATGLVDERYDLAISSFAACHLADLGKFYAEARHLTRPSGKVVLVDYHPFMLLKGVPTHFTAPSGADGDRQRRSSLLGPCRRGRQCRPDAPRIARAVGRREWIRENQHVSLASRVWRAIWAIRQLCDGVARA
jgi:SAM-dependent methyltransferase